MFLEITIRIPSVKIFTNFSKNFNQHFTLSLEKIKKVKTKKKSDHEVNKIYPLPRGRGKKQKLAKSSLFFRENQCNADYKNSSLLREVCNAYLVRFYFSLWHCKCLTIISILLYKWTEVLLIQHINKVGNWNLAHSFGENLIVYMDVMVSYKCNYLSLNPYLQTALSK